mgnify:CR=1 FL=1
MLAFDHQMKRLGFAGNQAQIILGFDQALPLEALARRIQAMGAAFPLISGVVRRRLLCRTPYWKVKNSGSKGRRPPFPRLIRHEAAADPEARRQLRRRILNQPLETGRGELVRFDWIETGGTEGERAGELIMTWSHMLMDAHGAEIFLALLGGGLSEECIDGDACRLSESYTRRLAGSGQKQQWEAAKASFAHVDELAGQPPVSLYTQADPPPPSRFDYQVRAFSPGQTRLIRQLSAERCGFLNESACYLSATLAAFHGFAQSRQMPPAGYVVPLSVDLRKKGALLPLFTNQSATLLYGFSPETAKHFDAILEAFNRQTRSFIQEDLIASNVNAMELGRILPAWLYARKIKQAFQGEIASLVFANPGPTSAYLDRFMGLSVQYEHHVPAIVVPPGLGVIFYTFRDRLFITLVHVESLITPDEASSLTSAIQDHLIAGLNSGLTDKAAASGIR